jgi:hypothetical protein
MQFTNLDRWHRKLFLTLGRNRDLGVKPVHIAVALAEKHSGPEWMEKFVVQAADATAVSF